MQEFNIDAFNKFIHNLITSLMTNDDYALVMDELGFPSPINSNPMMYKTGCHNEDFSQAHYNLAYYPDNRSFYCFSGCQKSYNILDLVKQRFELIGQKKTTYKCVQWICEVCDIEFCFNPSTKQRNIEYDWKKSVSKYRNRGKSSKEEDLKAYDDSILDYFEDIYHSDWLDYGISIDTMKKYEIKFYPYKSQILIPCRDRLDNLRGIRVRNMDLEAIKEGTPRYMPLSLLDGSTYKFRTNTMLYGELQNEEYIKKKKEAWLVESEKAVLKFDTWTKGKSCALGMMGSAISEESVRYIISLGVNHIVIMLDSDFKEINSDEFRAFEKKVMKIADKFTPYMKVDILYNNLGFDGYKFSPTDFTKEQFRKLWKSKERIE